MSVSDNKKDSSFYCKGLVENSLIGISVCKLITDDKGRAVDYFFEQINKAFSIQSGMQYEEVVGKKISEILPYSDAQRYISIAGIVVEKQIVHLYREYIPKFGRTLEIHKFFLAENTFGINIRDVSDSALVEQSLRSHIEYMDMVNSAILNARGLEEMLDSVLETTLSIFNVERAWLMYPENIETHNWVIRKE